MACRGERPFRHAPPAAARLVTDTAPRDHGGGIDAAAATYGGGRSDWLDLSTGINPVPYPIPDMPADAWTALPDHTATDKLESAARRFWNIPDEAAVLAAPGASALIARIPALAASEQVAIPGPTYNEHAAAFRAQGWHVSQRGGAAQVIVNPNNPDGRMWRESELAGAPLTVIDESFCDIAPDASLIHCATHSGVIVLKSFGKFWGLAGARLGFAIGDPRLVAQLADWLGPWPLSGPAQAIGTAALLDKPWAVETRARLATDSARLDELMIGNGAELVGGTPLFRLYDTQNAAAWQGRLAQRHIWSRVFPYSDRWLRLGLPGAEGWNRLEAL
ncbi:threonine-phosphate decarboxylase [Meridianimarinicoccus aquatilis]|uniref:threonine-phosphate decarboxylase n=1 Tax=Meridianimarinicoccus aquatilis TaxID=2552766 RepID=A0A4R6AXX1_9RHOB|nr:threonine-phosphate decarboxylase [Fluviibacterium aquatile]